MVLNNLKIARRSSVKAAGLPYGTKVRQELSAFIDIPYVILVIYVNDTYFN